LTITRVSTAGLLEIETRSAQVSSTYLQKHYDVESSPNEFFQIRLGKMNFSKPCNPYVSFNTQLKIVTC